MIPPFKLDGPENMHSSNCIVDMSHIRSPDFDLQKGVQCDSENPVDKAEFLLIFF